MSEARLNGPVHGVDFSRVTVPILLVIAFGATIGMAAYTWGGLIESIKANREMTSARLVAIELSIAKLERALAQSGCSGRKKTLGD